MGWSVPLAVSENTELRELATTPGCCPAVESSDLFDRLKKLK